MVSLALKIVYENDIDFNSQRGSWIRFHMQCFPPPEGFEMRSAQMEKMVAGSGDMSQSNGSTRIQHLLLHLHVRRCRGRRSTGQHVSMHWSLVHLATALPTIRLAWTTTEQPECLVIIEVIERTTCLSVRAASFVLKIVHSVRWWGQA
jgi:hypothetical protein